MRLINLKSIWRNTGHPKESHKSKYHKLGAENSISTNSINQFVVREVGKLYPTTKCGRKLLMNLGFLLLAHLLALRSRIIIRNIYLDMSKDFISVKMIILICQSLLQEEPGNAWSEEGELLIKEAITLSTFQNIMEGKETMIQLSQMNFTSIMRKVIKIK